MTIDSEAQPRHESVISGILGEWKSAGVGCVALRGYELLPRQVGNDLDVLVAERDQRTAESLLVDSVVQHGMSRFMRVERSAGYLVSHRFFDRMSTWNLAIDIWTGLTWRGIPFLDAERVLDERKTGGPIDVPRPAHEAAASLFGKALHGSWVREDRREQIRKLVMSDESEFRRVGELAFGVRRTDLLLERVRRLELAPDPAETRRLRLALIVRAGGRSPARVVTGFTRELLRISKRARRPSGVFLVMLGPDGSGKSSISMTLSDRLEDRLGSDGSMHFHWKPFRALDQRDPGPVSAPHAQPVRSRGASRAFQLFHWLEFLFGSWLTIQPKVIRGLPVIGERYYLDVWLDPVRYRLDPGRRTEVPELYGVRRPDLILCLTAPAEILQNRKKEVPITETRRQLHALQSFAESEKSARIIDVDKPFEDVLYSCEIAVLEYLAQRDRGREVRTRGRLS